jgi:uncharacterized protein (DUF1778 family)
MSGKPQPKKPPPKAGHSRRVPRPARLEARVPADVHALLKRAAEIQGRSLTDFVVTAASEAARHAIEDMQVVRLSVEDQRAVFDSILEPPPPTPALRRAFAWHGKLVRTSQ